MVSFLSMVAIAASVLIIHILTTILYNILLHPLRHYPGPKLWSATSLPWTSHNMSGTLIYRLASLHSTYGPVVRITPNQLSYTTANAWKTIYGHQASGFPEFQKDTHGFALPPPDSGVHGLPTAPTAVHRRQRRQLAPAFSEKALREQEGVLIAHVDMLIKQLHKRAAGQASNKWSEKQDMVAWLNRLTFDVIGALAFGESFRGVELALDHSFITAIFDSIRLMPYVQFACYWGLMGVFGWFAPKAVIESHKEQQRYANERVDNALNAARENVERKNGGMSKARDTFWTYVLKEQDADEPISRGEVVSNAEAILVAGSETTATLISGVLYYLLLNKSTYTRLVSEIRDAFTNEEDITISSATALKYTNACLQEALRIYPPAPNTIARVTPAPGAEVDGQFVPAGTVVGVHQWSAHHSSANFHRADDFIPERWLHQVEDPAAAAEFANDNKAAMQVFSYGPRNCIGQNLAWAEMRLLITRLLWNFDFELCEESRDWMARQRAGIIWNKPALMMKLRIVER